MSEEQIQREWKPVVGYEGLYEVSCHGEIKTLYCRTKNKTLLAPFLDRGGYRSVRLAKDKKHKTLKIHRLVQIAFCGPRPPGHHCAHLDGNKLNNHFANLKWVTQEENELHKDLHGTKLAGSKHHQAKLKEKDIVEIRNAYRRTGYIYSNSLELAQKYGVSKGTISKIVSGKTWKCVARAALEKNGKLS